MKNVILSKSILILTAIFLILTIMLISPSNISNPTSITAYAATSQNVSALYPVDSTYTFIKSVEGYSAQCFWDVAQWTIGYGNKCPYSHTSNGVRGQKGGHTISEAQARELFSSKLSGYVNILKSNCNGLSMTQNQFDALLSATYNHGNVSDCPLKYYLQGTLTESQARTKYYEWCINKGTVDETGLRNRRKKEADLFFSDVPDPNPPINVALSKNQIWYDIKDTIILNATADNATTYWISVLDFLGNLNLETDISISTLDISTNIYLDLLVSEEVY